MTYPREIYLDDDTEARLASYIEEELSRHLSERGDFVNDLERWQRDYNAAPSTETATFPFQGASTIIIPLAAISIEAIHSRTMTTLFAINQFTVVKAQHKDWSDTTQPLQKFLDHELLNNVKIYGPLNNTILEITKFGSGVIKTGYEKITKTAVRKVKEDSEEEEEFTVIVKQGITVESVPVSRFLMPFAFTDPQTASWCGESHEDTPYTMRQNEVSGLFREKSFEKLRAHFSSTASSSNANSGTEFTKKQQEKDNMIPNWPQSIPWYELWIGFDVDKSEDSPIIDGQPSSNEERLTNNFDKELCVLFHRESKSFLSIRYNWNDDLRRPYLTGNYFPIEHRWNGIGVCKQSEQFQREITTQHRQRLDNATLANVRMIKISKLSGYGPNEPIFPGKMWFVDNMDDVETFQLGEVYSSSYSNESQSLLYHQQRTGINEVNLGMPQVGTPGTATSDLARIQEGNKKFDFVYRNIKTLVNNTIKQSVIGIKQFGPHSLTYYDKVEDGNLVKLFFKQDVELIRHGLLVEISAAGQQENKLLDRNNWQQIASTLTGYYDSLLALAERTGDQQLMLAITNKGLTAATEAMKQYLESFDIKNIDRITFNRAESNGTLPTAPAGAPSGPISPEQITGMAGGNGTAPQYSGAGR